MKILHVIPYFTPRRGGDVTVCSNLAKQMSLEGHDVTVITTDFELDHNFADSHREMGVQVVPFKTYVNIALFLYSPLMMTWLRDNLKTYDIVHLHDFRTYQNNVVSQWAKKFGVPYVLQPHGSLPRIIEKQVLKKIYDLNWGKRLVTRAAAVIAVSEAEIQQIISMGWENTRLFTVPNGVDIEKFSQPVADGRFRERYQIEENYVILYLGRIHRRKGIDFLIRAYYLLQRDVNNAVLVIAGSDEGYRQDLEDLVKSLDLTDKVKFLDFVEDNLEAFHDADVVVYPAIFEIFGLVPFEAAMCGTPVIVTDDCGCGEIVKEADGGYLVKFGDVRTLTGQMKRVLENPEEARGHVNKLRDYITENLTWRETTNKMITIYEGILSNGGDS